MQVTITLYGPSREVVGEKDIVRQVDDGVTVRDVFESLQSEYPDLVGKLLTDEGEIASGIALTRNGTAIERDGGLDAPVADGDELQVTHSLRGG